MEITKEYLLEEYINKGRTAKEIAEELGVKRTRIKGAVARFGLTGIKPQNKSLDIGKQTLYDLYVTQDLTRKETASKLDITVTQLSKLLSKYGIIKHPEKVRDFKSQLKLSEKYLQNEYMIKRRSAYDIAEEHNLTDSEIEYMLERYCLYGNKGNIKDLCNEDKFDVKDPIFCYYAGLIATDGYIDLANKRVVLRLCDDGADKMLRNLAEYFEFTGEVKEYPQYGTNNSGKPQNDLTITSEKLIEELAKLNIVGVDKTFTLKFPSEFHSEDCARMFIRGVIDGDGSIRSNRGTISILMASKEFIDSVESFISNRLNIQCVRTTKTPKENTYYDLRLNTKESTLLGEWLYIGFEKYRLECKFKRHLEIFKY